MRTTLLLLTLAACGTSEPSPDAGSDASTDAASPDATDAAATSDADASLAAPTVYSCSATTLYTFDPVAKSLAKVGAFGASADGGASDPVTDIAVGLDGTIWAISATKLYTVAPTDGHATVMGALTACGTGSVALTALSNGKLYTADSLGAVCSIDTTNDTVTPIGTVGGKLAVNDFVGLADGTLYATAIDTTNATTQTNNLFISLDPTTGASKKTIGPIGSGHLFGLAYAGGKALAFSHDGTGAVVAIDPTSGAGTPLGTFSDPDTHALVTFVGAAVSPNVSP